VSRGVRALLRLSRRCDLAFVNGNILTVDARFSTARALAVCGDRIAAVGDDEQIKPLIGTGTEVVDLKGRTVLPGINDSHSHTALWAGTRPPYVLDLSYPNVRSVRDIVEQIRRKVEPLPSGEWVRGVGWDAGYLEECLSDPRFSLDRSLLDAVSPDNPVALADFSVHSLWVNTLALRAAGIGRDTVGPVGGGIEKDDVTGEPTGVLREFAAADLVMSLIPPLTRAEKKEAIAVALDEMSTMGITSMTEPALGPGGDRYQGGLLGSECIGAYQDLLEERRLKVRVNVLYLLGDYGSCSLADLEAVLPALGFHSGFGNEKLKIGGVKIFADGIPPNRTAWVSREYVGGGHGSLVIPGSSHAERSRELEKMIRYAHALGFQVGIHSIGDLAIEAAISGFVKAETEDPRGLRHYLMHVDFVTAEQARTVAHHGFGVNITPTLPWTISDMNVDILGLEQVEKEWPYRLVADAGCHLAASSDAPCTYPSWLQGVQYAVLRETKATGKVYSPDQRLTVSEAIRMYTIGGAWQDGQEGIKGSLEPGKLADLCVLDEDILGVDPHDITSIRNVMTVMDGEVVFASGI
jgi:predicted amidohydrolase YtcJ